KWMEKLKLSGGFLGDFRLLADPLLAPSSVSDLYLRRIEIGVNSTLVDWVSAIIVFNSEWLGDSLHPGDAILSIDEAHLDLHVPRTPFYTVFGLRTQPFGQFESSMINDPLTQDAYETKKVGMTIGVTGPLGLDASLTIYRGDELLSHLFASGIFDGTAVARADPKVRRVDSMVLALAATPVDDSLHLGAAFSSEPGAGRRNETLNVFFSLNPAFLKHLVIEGDWMRALRRETYVGRGRPFREGAFSIELSWIFGIDGARPRTNLGGGSYLARRSHLRAHPVEASLRFESFADDGLAAASGAWSVRRRLGVGGRYTFSHSGNLAVFVAAEGRHETRRRAAAADEFLFRLGLDF
ncbi:MAG TPA: hypothetical protein VF451_04805, partial [Acidobacteriota bacterium]